MTTSDNVLTIRIKEKNGEMRRIGCVSGDQFISVLREPTKHGFRGGADTWADAVKQGTAGWGLDLAVMETLARDHGVRRVEIPTRARRYRATMDAVLGEKSFVIEYAGHRRQTVLPLQFWIGGGK